MNLDVFFAKFLGVHRVDAFFLALCRIKRMDNERDRDPLKRMNNELSTERIVKAIVDPDRDSIHCLSHGSRVFTDHY